MKDKLARDYKEALAINALKPQKEEPQPVDGEIPQQTVVEIYDSYMIAWESPNVGIPQ